MAPIIITTIIMMILFQFSMVGASWNAAMIFNDDDESKQQEHYITVVAGGETRISKASGDDETKEEATLVLERFRVLLGLGKLHKLRPVIGSPSPSPSPTATAPSPARAWHVQERPHHRYRQPHLSKVHRHPAYKFHKHDERRNESRRVLVAALMAIGCTLVICGAFLVWGTRKYYDRRKKWRTSLNGSGERSKSVTSQSLASKVRHDPGFDPFYVETLANVLEPQACVKEHSNYLTTSSIQNSSTCTLHDTEDLEHELGTFEPREGSLSSAEEIVSIHEYSDSIKYVSEGHITSEGDKAIISESHLSDHDDEDDESFYSLCGSESSNVRFSNASLDSLSHIAKDISSKGPSTSHDPLSSKGLPMTPTSNSDLCLSDQEPQTQNIPNDQHSQNDSKVIQPPLTTPPKPPPPPPPPPPLPSFSTHTLTKPKFPILLKGSSTGNSGSSGSTQRTGYLDHPPKIDEPLRAPPPCPPPVIQQNINSLKGQPPPPPRPPQLTPLCKHGSLLPKLKPLHWDKVRAASDRLTVWDKLRCSSFELDEEMIESLFGYNLKTALANDEGKSKTPSPSKHVLEPKRLQNLTILSKALNVTAEQVCTALIQGDNLSLQQLEALAKMAPTKEEEDKLSTYKGDVNELGSAEKLVRAMLNIPYAFQRIEAMLFKATFDDEVVHLQNSLSMLEEACKELRSSRLFLKLLEAVLKTGNRMNVGTIRGGARAFKLDALLKLADVKGTDGKTTLLHFVVQEIVRSEGIRMSESIIGKINLSGKSRTMEEKEEDYRRMGLELVSGLSTELYNVKKTASIDLDVLASSVSNLSDGISKLQQLSQKDLITDATAINFARQINTFVTHAEENLKELRRREDAVFQSVSEITEYFHGDVSRDEVNPLRIFVIVRDFLGMLDQACRELRSSKTPKSPNPLAPFC